MRHAVVGLFALRGVTAVMCLAVVRSFSATAYFYGDTLGTGRTEYTKASGLLVRSLMALLPYRAVPRVARVQGRCGRFPGAWLRIFLL